MSDSQAEETEALRQYKELVLGIGRGFHPDTPFDDYEPPLTGISEEDFNQVIANAFEVCDPYEVGLELFHLMGDLDE